MIEELLNFYSLSFSHTQVIGSRNNITSMLIPYRDIPISCSENSGMFTGLTKIDTVQCFTTQLCGHRSLSDVRYMSSDEQLGSIYYSVPCQCHQQARLSPRVHCL